MSRKRIEARDPDPIAVIALLVGGVSMLINLDRRFSDLRKISNDRARAVEIGRIRIALLDCAQAVERLQWFWSEYSKLGQTEIRSDEFRPGAVAKFLTAEQYAVYADLLDDALRSIGRLNRALGVILFSEAGVDAETRQRLEEVLGRLRQRCGDALSGRLTAKAALEAVQSILADAQTFLRTAHFYFGRDIEPQK